jgi:hypothetical protein
MPTLSQHVCFRCRKVFKKPHDYPFLQKEGGPFLRTIYPCPECGAQMTYMGYKFRAPRLADVKEWRRIEEGMKSGSDWQKPTKRKIKPKPTISHALKKALGIQNKK